MPNINKGEKLMLFLLKIMNFLSTKKKILRSIFVISLIWFCILLIQSENNIFKGLGHAFGLNTKQSVVYVDNIEIEQETVLRQYSVINLSDIKPSLSNIFFIESSCATQKLMNSFSQNQHFLLNPRQCCSVESTAYNNPDRNLYIIYTCPLDSNLSMRIPKFAQKMLSRPNVHIVRCNITEISDGTPVQDLIRSKRIENSDNPIEHSSDVLRLALLWKFGGTYLDLDIVTIKSLNQLGSNFCGRERDDFVVGNAVLNFEPTGHGHDLMTKALEFLNQNFTGTGWGKNGPALITKIAQEECGTLVSELPKCKTLKVYDLNYFYPVRTINKFTTLFNKMEGPKIVAEFKKSSYIVHVWNRHSKQLRVKVNSTQAYGLLADQFCPDVYRNCGKYF